MSVRCMFVSLDRAGGKVCGTIHWSGILATLSDWVSSKIQTQTETRISKKILIGTLPWAWIRTSIIVNFYRFLLINARLILLASVKSRHGSEHLEEEEHQRDVLDLDTSSSLLSS
ncbi:hypothetical protein YC2023_110073 [Brassica napus]